MQEPEYTGRFAPTPSGPLHFGSVIAALGSFLQARSRQGRWLVRIDDVDTSRSRSGADTIILKQLEQLGLSWDNAVVYQSQRTARYHDALALLREKELLYVCQCTRKQLGKQPYPGTCRQLVLEETATRSLRLKTDNQCITVPDALQTGFSQQLQTDTGDFIVRRADGLVAYHLATVIDDQEQRVTEIVRGADLLETTPAQIYLQRCLGIESPDYLHLPVAIDRFGKKLSKSDQAISITTQAPERTLCQALAFLGQLLPDKCEDARCEELLDWALQHWNSEAIPRQQKITVDSSFD